MRLDVVLRIPMTPMQQKNSKKWLRRSSLTYNPQLPVISPHFLHFSYEILNDPSTREEYDAHGMAGLDGPGGPGGMSPDDLFAHFFGAGGFGFEFGPGGPSRRRKGQNEVVPYDVTLEDLYNGKSVKLNMEKDVTCNVCKG